MFRTCFAQLCTLFHVDVSQKGVSDDKERLVLQVKGIRALLVSKYYNLSRAVGHLFYARHKFWVNFFHQKLKRYGLFHHVAACNT